MTGMIRQARANGGDATIAGIEQRMHKPWVAVAWRAGAVFVFLLLIAAGSTLWDRDEPRFARAAVEMLRSGDWLVPHFNGEVRPDKPVLIYWLMAGPLAVLGPTALAVRLPSVVMMTAASVLTYAIGRQLFDHRTGLWAMVILPTTLLAAAIGTLATADATLLAGILLTIWGFLAWDRARRRAWLFWIVMALGFGAAQLAKGPVGLAVPGLMMLALYVRPQASGLTPRAAARRLAGAVAAMAVGFGLFAAWGVPANLASGGVLLDEGIGRHVVERMHTPQESHGGESWLGYLLTLPTYIVVVIVGFFPWTLILPGVLAAMIRGRCADQRTRAVLWAWILPTFVLMSLVATKLPHYILPIFPALAVACGWVVAHRPQETWTARDRDWLRGGIWFFGAVNIGLAVVVAVGPWVLGDVLGGVAGVALAAGIIVLGELAVRAQRREEVQRSALLLVRGVPVLVVAVIWAIVPGVEQALKPSPRLAAAVAATGLPSTAVATAGYDEPSLVFYLDRPHDAPLPMFGSDPARVRQWTEERGPGLLIVERDVLDAAGALPVHVVYEQPALNYSSRGRAMDLLVVERGR